MAMRHQLKIINLVFLIIPLILVFMFFVHPAYACHHTGEPIPAGQPPHNPNQPAFPNAGPCPAGLDQIETVFGNVISAAVGLGFMVMLVMGE